MTQNSYRDCILACDRYIEEHPGEKITAGELAELTGYSLPHFSMVFHSFTDMPLSVYVRNIRLRKAARAIASGSSVTQAAMDAGFDTPAGFHKAFRRLFSISPQEYQRRIKAGRKELLAALEFREVPACDILGYRISGKGFPSAAAAWQHVDFSSLPKYPEELVSEGEIGIWLTADPATGEFVYFFGALTDRQEVPEGFSRYRLEPACYAVFCASDTVWTDTPEATSAKVAEAWKAVFSDWFPAQQAGGSPVRYDEGHLSFELYKGSCARLYVPVVCPEDRLMTGI